MSFRESDVQNQVSLPRTRDASFNNNDFRPISQVVVFTDIDDTCYPTKSKAFYTGSKSGVFPGMSEFLLALTKGVHNHKPRPINVVSARAGNTLQFFKIGEKSKISKSLQKAGGSLGDVLYGKIGDQTSFIRGSMARRVALADRKAKNISSYMRTLTKVLKQLDGKVGGSEVWFMSPSSEDEKKDERVNKRKRIRKRRGGEWKLQAIFCGDNGEGDYLAAEHMINNFPDMKAVFIHKVDLSSKDNCKSELRRKDELRRLSSLTQLNPRQSDRPKLLLYDTVAEASMMAYRHGLVSLSSLQTIYNAIVKSDLYKQHNPRRKSLSPRSDEPSQHKPCVAKTPDGQWVTIEKAWNGVQRVACIPSEKLVCLPQEKVRYRVSSVEKREVKDRRKRAKSANGDSKVLEKRDLHLKYNFEDRHRKQFFDHAWRLKKMLRELIEKKKLRTKRANKRCSRSLSPPPVSRRRRVDKGRSNILYRALGEDTAGLEDGLSPPDVLIGGERPLIPVLSMPELEYETSLENTPTRQEVGEGESMTEKQDSEVDSDPWRLNEPVSFPQQKTNDGRANGRSTLPVPVSDVRRKSDPVGLNVKFFEDEPAEYSPEALGMIQRTMEFLQLSSSNGQLAHKSDDSNTSIFTAVSVINIKPNPKECRSLAIKL